MMKEINELVRDKICNLIGDDKDILTILRNWECIAGERLAKYSVPMKLYNVEPKKKRLVIRLLNDGIFLEMHHSTQTIKCNLADILNQNGTEFEIVLKKSSGRR